jgi:hypothetical protein
VAPNRLWIAEFIGLTSWHFLDHQAFRFVWKYSLPDYRLACQPLAHAGFVYGTKRQLPCPHGTE